MEGIIFLEIVVIWDVSSDSINSLIQSHRCKQFEQCLPHNASSVRLYNKPKLEDKSLKLLLSLLGKHLEVLLQCLCIQFQKWCLPPYNLYSEQIINISLWFQGGLDGGCLNKVLHKYYFSLSRNRLLRCAGPSCEISSWRLISPEFGVNWWP